MLKKIADFDNRVSVCWTNRHFSPKTDRWLKFYVRLGDGYIWALFVLFIFWRVGFDNFLPILWQALMALAMSLVIYEVVKLNTKRPPTRRLRRRCRRSTSTVSPRGTR